MDAERRALSALRVSHAGPFESPPGVNAGPPQADRLISCRVPGRSRAAATTSFIATADWDRLTRLAVNLQTVRRSGFLGAWSTGDAPLDERGVHRVVLERDGVRKAVSLKKLPEWAGDESLVHVAAGAGVDDGDAVGCAQAEV